MSRKGIRWLYGELPKLVDARILTDEDALRLRTHYGDLERRVGLSPGFVICAVLGAVLISLGVILLFAHNWHELSRPFRVSLSFAPLVLGQGLTLWVVLCRPASRPWCEGSAVFLMGGVGAAIALIGQTYHISGDPESFLLSWMLLSVPLVYIPGASTPAALYWIGITVWSGMLHGRGDVWFWPLAAVPLWHLIRLCRDSVRRPRVAFLLWTLALCLAIATGTTLGTNFRYDWILAYGGLFSLFYLVDSRWPRDGVSLWCRPFCMIGSAGILVLSLVLTFDHTWETYISSSSSPLFGDGLFYAFCYLMEHALLFAIVLLPVLFFFGDFRGRRYDRLVYGSFGILSIVAYLLTQTPAASYIMLIFNLYLALLGILTLRSGLRTGTLLKVNGGLIVLSTLITVRFFDSDIPFTARGILFILIGVGFLAANGVARRRKGAA